jgi:crotonobetainyl-CoA:carnitine CoA-transferase CaiB-like acyl-CoA transferase
MVSTPCDFEGTPWEPSFVAPRLGEHTVNVLMEIGFTEDQIRQLTSE